MKITRVIAISILAAHAALGIAEAQTLRNAGEPAEFPPADYKGTQYIDSRGCVYIRAGIDGNVSWVPRVARNRRQICGMEPTRLAGSAQGQAAPAAVQITLDTPPAAPAPEPAAAAKPAPKPKPAAVRKPVSKKVAKPRPAPKPAPAPVVVAAAPAPKPAAAPVQAANTQVRRTGSPACQGASAISSQYINSGKNAPVRCGPQSGLGGTVAARNSIPASNPASISPEQLGTAVASNTLPGSTRVVPLHVARKRSRVGAYTVPHGFRSAWEDDRLNPHRAEGTLAGRDAMNLIWTNTVPRRLIDRNSGRDVTAKVALVYPFTNLATQRRELGEVTLMTRNGQLVKRIVRNPGAPSAAELARRAAPASATISTKSAPVAAPKQTVRAKPQQVAKTRKVAAPVQRQAAKPSATGSQFVQVGTFGQPANAQATAQRLAGMGLPVRIGKLTRDGKSYSLVMAGPFVAGQQAQSALSTVRRAGFADAYLRR